MATAPQMYGHAAVGNAAPWSGGQAMGDPTGSGAAMYGSGAVPGGLDRFQIGGQTAGGNMQTAPAMSGSSGGAQLGQYQGGQAPGGNMATAQTAGGFGQLYGTAAIPGGLDRFRNGGQTVGGNMATGPVSQNARRR